MKINYKVIPYKTIFVACAIGILLYVLKEFFEMLLFFDTSAPDLGGKGEMIRIQFLFNTLEFGNFLFYYNDIQPIAFMFVFLISGNMYYFLRKRYIKYYIGNEEDAYHKKLRSLKVFLALKVVAVFIIIFLILLSISACFSNTSLAKRVAYAFADDSVLKPLITTDLAYIVFVIIHKSISLFVFSLLLYSFIDYFNSFIKGALTLIVLLWVATPILHILLPKEFVPIMALMASSILVIGLPLYILPYTGIILIFIFLKITKKYEVD